MLENKCNLAQCGYDAHDLVVVQSYNYIHEVVCHHVVNLAYRYVNT